MDVAVDRWNGGTCNTSQQC